MKTRILFVCHGNICRSPVAEFVMKKLVKDAGRETEFAIASCATSTEELGNPIYPPSAACLRQHKIPFSDHRARQLTKQDYSEYDMILYMDAWNLRNILRIIGSDPDGKVRRLLDFTEHPRDVADPWYTRDFEAAYQDILDGCTALLAKV